MRTHFVPILLMSVKHTLFMCTAMWIFYIYIFIHTIKSYIKLYCNIENIYEKSGIFG